MSFDETDARSDYKMSIGDEEKGKEEAALLRAKESHICFIYVSYIFHNRHPRLENRFTLVSYYMLNVK